MYYQAMITLNILLTWLLNSTGTILTKLTDYNLRENCIRHVG